MSETPPPSGSESAPIDAEFEPARPAPQAAHKPASSGGPGWFSFLVLSLIALSGLGLGLYNHFPENRDDHAQMQDDISEMQAYTQELMQKLSAQEQALVRFSDTDPDLSELNAKLEQLEQQLELLQQAGTETRGSAEPVTTPAVDSVVDISAIETDLSRLTQRVMEIEAAVLLFDSQPMPERLPVEIPLAAVADHQTRLTALEESLATVQQDLQNLEENATAQWATLQTETAQDRALLAFSLIERSVAKGEAFQAAYAQLMGVRPEDIQIAELAEFADQPIPTWAELQQAFVPAAQAAEALARTEQSGTPGWLENLVGDGIRVRRPDAALVSPNFEAAAAALTSETPSESIAIIAALDPALQIPFTEWLQNARARQKLDLHLERVRQALLTEDRP